jgi:DegV family protein with EDD domain
MKKGTNSAYRAILNPVEGTILDVVRTVGRKSAEMAKGRKEKNIIKILGESLTAGQKALEETKNKLEVLRQNDVVDAGGLGFVKILEAWIESLKKETLEAREDLESSAKSLYQASVNQETDYQSEIVFIIEREGVNLGKIKEDLAQLGGSIDVLGLEDKIKLHIHTNSIEEVKKALKGSKILGWREESLISKEKRIVVKKPLGLVVGETANLPREFLEKNQIENVPFKIIFSDKESLGSEDFYQKLKKARNIPTTSAATFNDYFSYYKKALERFEKILVITLPSKLSGAYSQAKIARSIFKKPEKLNIFVFDCFTVEVAEGLIVMRAQELILAGKKIDEIIEELKIFCPKVKLMGLITDIKYVVRGGRFKIPRIFTPLISLIQKTGISLLFILEDGKVKLVGARFGKNLAEILAEEVKSRSNDKEIKAAIAHAGNPEAAKELKEILERNPKIKVLFTSLTTPAIGTHAGPGALIVGFYPVDK